MKMKYQSGLKLGTDKMESKEKEKETEKRRTRGRALLKRGWTVAYQPFGW